MTEASEDHDAAAFIHNFSYPLSSLSRTKDNEQMARLNYMGSRVRAALCQWATSSNTEETALWWWTGMKKELVTYKILSLG